MPYVKRLTPIGNSTGLVIDRPFLQQLDLAPDAEVEVSIENNAIVIRPHRYATDEEGRAAGRKVFAQRGKLMERLAK